MRRVVVLIIAFLLCGQLVKAHENTRKEYIQKFKDLAIREMKRTGIPASITLAQGLLESRNGNSVLARKGNNHFGIKCHDWRGKTMRIDDDKRNECFRKYKSAYDSYMDHSKFLTTRSRYAFLFKLKSTDYKRWAHGLKKAGYATNPRYAHILIKIIEEEKLYVYDSAVKKRHGKTIEKTNKKLANIDEDYEIDPFGARLEELNGVHFIVVKKGDTFYSIERNLGVSKKKLLRYNELPSGYVLQVDQILFLHAKKNKAARGYNFHRVKEGDTMYSIAQKYGVKLRKLYKYNRMRRGEEPYEGDRIWLRKKSR
ncbi:MAG: glucosaminidase domain-containing protein [Marinifilaceae bacterium]